MVVQIVTNLKGPNGFGGKAYTYFVSYVCIHLSAKKQKAKKTFPVEKHSDNQSCSTTENEISPIYLDWCSLSALNTDTDTEFIFPKNIYSVWNKWKMLQCIHWCLSLQGIHILSIPSDSHTLSSNYANSCYGHLGLISGYSCSLSASFLSFL